MSIRSLGHLGMMLSAIVLFAGMTSAQTASIQAEPQQSVFVGTEPIKIRFLILVTTGVRVYEDDLKEADVAPFQLESVTIGDRIAIPERKDEGFIEATLVVRPPETLALGVHVIRPIGVGYGFTTTNIIGMQAERRDREKVASTNPIELEKVSLYATTDLLHEVARIGDANVASLDVHVAEDIEVYNDLLPETPLPDMEYLQEPVFQEPLALLDVDRTEQDYETHRIISYRYRFSVMDVPKKPVPVLFSPIHYGIRGGKTSDLVTKEIGPSQVRVVSVLEKNTSFEPMKGVFTEAPWEEYAFWWVPMVILIIAGMCCFGMGLHETITVFRAWKQKKSDDLHGDEILIDLPVPTYERNVFRRLLLRRAADKALIAFTASPGLATCAVLRNNVARLIASGSRTRLSRQEACALSAQDLESHCSEKDMRWLAIIVQADSQLARRSYANITDPQGEST